MTILIGSLIDPTYPSFCSGSEKPDPTPPTAPTKLSRGKYPKVPMDGFFPCASNSARTLGCGAAPSLLGWSGEGCSPVSRQAALVLSVCKHRDDDPEKSLG